MNPILTEVLENGEEVVETTKTFWETLNENPGVVGFAVGCLVLAAVIGNAIYNHLKKNKKRK